jgi:iron complex transport system ATP-binding protein
VLKDITLDITGPKFVSILGPNGVGKSTLIHCINKILTPTSGTVLIDDRDVTEFTIKEMAKIVGYVPYSANDTFPLSVVDTVLMGRHPHSKWGSLDEDLDIVYDTLKLLGISHLAMRSFNELSAGQHQKVMLARGLVQEPKILLLDEPTSNLDVRHQLDVTKMLKRLSEEKSILIIMISHDINIAAKYSDSVIMLHGGTVYAVGTPQEVITEDNLKHVYGVEAKVIEDEGMPHVILRDAVPMSEDNQEMMTPERASRFKLKRSSRKNGQDRPEEEQAST